LGSKVTSFGSPPSRSNSEWANGLVQECILVKIKDSNVWFHKTTGNNRDEGLIDFNVRSNEVGIVQQNQFYSLVCGYTLDDPLSEKKNQIFTQSIH